jgi:hypothetical protein
MIAADYDDDKRRLSSGIEVDVNVDVSGGDDDCRTSGLVRQAMLYI